MDKLALKNLLLQSQTIQVYGKGKSVAGEKNNRRAVNAIVIFLKHLL